MHLWSPNQKPIGVCAFNSIQTRLHGISKKFNYILAIHLKRYSELIKLTLINRRHIYRITLYMFVRIDTVSHNRMHRSRCYYIPVHVYTCPHTPLRWYVTICISWQGNRDNGCMFVYMWWVLVLKYTRRIFLIRLPIS